MENDNDISRETIKKLYSSGRGIGELFTLEIEDLIKINKDLFDTPEEILIQKARMNAISSELLSVLYMNIHPYLWTGFLEIMSHSVELMKTEAQRIAKENLENNDG